MPKKKGKKAGKPKGKKTSFKTNDDSLSTDPIAPEYIVPAPQPRETLLKLLLTNPVKEKELFGIQVSTRALEKLTPQEIRDLRMVFEAFDINERGYIGAVEVRKAMLALGFRMTRDDARQMVQDASVKGKGTIDFNEFLDIVLDKQGDSKDIYDEINQGFKLFDHEGIGKVSLNDLVLACREAGVKLAKQELLDMMEVADLNGDGFVDKDEFIKVMLQTNLF
ncbi:hypothetical protein CAPTEDRAFT_156723 [Capitella teleta]|uniref:EF-hand domain-containing protein n=1 Tax=Capitella teleta TaxID=283909 RepID=R7VJ41_CAPTE|nr:hypothetical protein CAPTEDRAFT_156723 [Capitella teleta]|eukprot:ELU15735.1 hypothetical protein CAPTEDRAFT_156723 [Capitella teleta]